MQSAGVIKAEWGSFEVRNARLNDFTQLGHWTHSGALTRTDCAWRCCVHPGRLSGWQETSRAGTLHSRWPRKAGGRGLSKPSWERRKAGLPVVCTCAYVAVGGGGVQQENMERNKDVCALKKWLSRERKWEWRIQAPLRVFTCMKVVIEKVWEGE